MPNLDDETTVIFRRIASSRGVMSAAPQRTPSTIDYKELDTILSGAGNDDDLFQRIVDTPFDRCKVQTTFLFLGTIGLLLVNKETGLIKRIALSDINLDKPGAMGTAPFNESNIRVNDPKNMVAAAIRTGEMRDTTDWKSLSMLGARPQRASVNQANASIAYAAAYPLKARDGGALIFGYFHHREAIGDLRHDFMKKYASFVTKRLNQ